jgi:adenine-specific DNA-methyltransferase
MLLEEIEITRKEAIKRIDHSKRSELGQFFTPDGIAKFMAGMFTKDFPPVISVLDAGAAVGSLSGAFLDQVLSSKSPIKTVVTTTYEVDDVLNEYLASNLEKYKILFEEKDIDYSFSQHKFDFIKGVIPQFVLDRAPMFSHAILNPPYRKINSDSDHRKLLRLMKFETVNLYAAFVGTALNLLIENGELVAIIPRSFCNGNYYKGFRELIINTSCIKQLHLFESRTHAFKEDDVLQENIIIHLVKGQVQEKVLISRSTNSSFDDLTKSYFEFSDIVHPNDLELFFHVPDVDNTYIHPKFNNSLKELNIYVSTGPVVDFRARDVISQKHEDGFVPLIYSVHFDSKEVDWPKDTKKPNAIRLNGDTIKMLYPNGYYTVVKRFSPKEEKQRIVARVINPKKLKFDFIGIENHLNVFHAGKVGLTKYQAFGLAAFLNSSFIDKYFRTFNGHTQVNATDLKQLPYPSAENLIVLGKWASKQKSFDQKKIDIQIAKL